MIQINETYSFDRDDYCWRLYETKPPGAHPITGVIGKKPSVTTTYHGSILQVCRAIIDRTAGEAVSPHGIIEEFLRVESELLKAINSMEK